MNEIIEAIAELLYGPAAPGHFYTFDEILVGLNQFGEADVEASIQQLERNGLLRISLQHHDSVVPTMKGKAAYERRC